MFKKRVIEMNRAEKREEFLNKLKEIKKYEDLAEDLKFIQIGGAMSLISVNNLTFGYDGICNNIFEDVSFNIDTDWKLGLIGRNGKGKTTLLKLLQGKYEYTGTISKNVDIDYFPFEVTNKERMAIEIVNEIAPNAEDWEIMKELNLLNNETEILYQKF